MPSLRELQAAFVDAAVGGDPTMIVAAIARTGIEPKRRFDIYANTARGNFVASLRSSFPVLLRLVGEQYFLQVARLYHHAHPSRSGDLLHTGERFAQFLRTQPMPSEFSYLSDVAHFEWLCQASLLAGDHAPLALDRLQRVAQSEFDALRFDLHPAARLFDSAYPIQRIWEANLDAEREPPFIDLGSGASRLLIMTRGLSLQFLGVTPGEHAFIAALERRAALDAAIEAATESEPQFDAGDCLRRLVAADAIIDFH